MPGEVSRSYDGPGEPLARTLTTADVRGLVEDAGKSYAVVVAVDRAAGTTQFVTWGRTAEDKLDARAMREHFEQEGGYDAPATVYEDFVRDAARVREKNEQARLVLIDAMSAERVGERDLSRSLVMRAMEMLV
jgi:hypothetical protein